MSAICEWTVAFGFVFFFLTFIKDFQVGIWIFLAVTENYELSNKYNRKLLLFIWARNTKAIHKEIFCEKPFLPTLWIYFPLFFKTKNSVINQFSRYLVLKMSQ